jgi:hypothetical protein
VIDGGVVRGGDEVNEERRRGTNFALHSQRKTVLRLLSPTTWCFQMSRVLFRFRSHFGVMYVLACGGIGAEPSTPSVFASVEAIEGSM